MLIHTRHIDPKKRPKFFVIVDRLHVDDEVLHQNDHEETQTNLGDELSASFSLYKDLQLTYSNNS